ncbi:MAG: hypothetical protein M1817_006126 [Caeruleum heppii]|nr:MAG: hypothetical protein M1817_006126 [Caeruleum heppii]
MPSGAIKPRATLGHALDREVYQVVRKLADEQTQYGSKNLRLTPPAVYERIKSSNSSLNRKSKKLLEDSIDRVISVIKDEEADDDAETPEGDFDGMQEDPVDEVNVMNKSIVGLWSVPRSNQSGPASPSAVGVSQSRCRQGASQLEQREVDGDGDLVSPKKRDRQANGEPVTKRRKGIKVPKDVDRSPPSHVSLTDLGGIENVVHDLTELIALPILYPEVYTFSGIQPPRGVLLHGPPGCGKTMIAHAFAAELGVSFIPISAPSIVSGMSGESEKKLRDCFDEAKKMAPCLMFIDEIDAITPKRESAQREMEKRIVAQMLTCMDDLALEKTDGKPVIIIAATNRPDSLDPALRRAGRFNKEINLSVPDEAAREKILHALTRKLRLSGSFDFRQLAKMTPGFVGADLNDLVSTAGVAATQRMFELLKEEVTQSNMDTEQNGDSATISEDVQTLRDLIKRASSSDSLSQSDLERMAITSEDFLSSIPKIQPSSKREGFATIPNTTWADIGALHSVRDELQMAIVEPIKRPERYEKVGITAPTGVLLWGPPGCGKTLLAKAVANESRANFISVKGPELLNKYVGESERAVRQVFVRARSSVPCVIFFDELDALVPKREDSMSEASSRVVNTLLTELDGLSSRQGIYIIAATNRPDIIDPAMLRPGRLGTLLFVDLPGPTERVDILATLIRQKHIPLAADVDVPLVATQADGFSGADLDSLLRAAGVECLRRDEGEEVIAMVDFDRAVRGGRVKRSVGEGEGGRYRALRGRWGG